MNKKIKIGHPKLFIQVNIGNEIQKSGIRVDQVAKFISQNFAKSLI